MTKKLGHGVDHVDVDAIDAACCYNFDGGGQGDIDIETFSADMALITFTGINIHPAIAKDKMSVQSERWECFWLSCQRSYRRNGRMAEMAFCIRM